MNSILYTRVSSHSQGQEGLQIQTQLCLDYLNNNGITLSGSYQEISSAFNGKQMALKNALEQNSNCTLFVLNVSRFSRNIVNAIEFMKLASEKSINIHFIEENLDSNNMTHHHTIRIKLSEAQLESENTSRRVSNSYKVLKAKGHKFGRAKYGYSASVNPKTKLRKFILNKKERYIMDFISQARDGNSCKILNNKLKKIIPNADPLDFYDTDGVTKIGYFNKANTLTFEEIADILNDYDILKRGKLWTASSVNGIYRKYHNLESKFGGLSI